MTGHFAAPLLSRECRSLSIDLVTRFYKRRSVSRHYQGTLQIVINCDQHPRPCQQIPYNELIYDDEEE